MGYLGRVTLGKLAERGHQVRVYDSLLYHADPKDVGSVAEFMNGDVRDGDRLAGALAGMDAVVHLAAIVGEAACNLDKEMAVNVNYLATRKLAELAGQKGIKMVFASTCSVYGAKPGAALDESSELFPLSIYAITKMASEEAVERHVRNHVTFRLGTLFGYSPRMRFDLVINRFIAQALQDRRISVFGGSQMRPFLHVQDAGDSIAKAVESDRSGLFNLGGTNLSISQVGELIKAKSGCEMALFEAITDPRNYAVNSAKAVGELGVVFSKDIGFAFREISDAYAKGIIADYREARHNNDLLMSGK